MAGLQDNLEASHQHWPGASTVFPWRRKKNELIARDSCGVKERQKLACPPNSVILSRSWKKILCNLLWNLKERKILSHRVVKAERNLRQQLAQPPDCLETETEVQGHTMRIRGAWVRSPPGSASMACCSHPKALAAREAKSPLPGGKAWGAGERGKEAGGQNTGWQEAARICPAQLYLISRQRGVRERLLEPQLPGAPSLSDMVIKWPGLEKCYETPESSVSSRRIITLLSTPLRLVLSPSAPALEMKAPAGCSLTQASRAGSKRR